MAKVKLFVGLKIPDTTAITTFHTLERMGYKNVSKIEREDYYEFDVSGDVEKFKKEIVKVDVIVNANKHYFKVDEEENKGSVNVIVMDSGDNGSGLLSTLKNRLGIKNVNSIVRGTLWKLYIDSKDARKIAEKITNELLHNENYQEYKIVE